MVSDLHIDKLKNILSLLLLFPLWFFNLVHQSLIYFKNQTYFCLSLHKYRKITEFPAFLQNVIYNIFTGNAFPATSKGTNSESL